MGRHDGRPNTATRPNLREVRPATASRLNLVEVRPATTSQLGRTASHPNLGDGPTRPTLGDALHMTPSLSSVQRAMSASHLHRPSSGADSVILDPLPPPRQVSSLVEAEEEQDDVHRNERLKVLEGRLKRTELGQRLGASVGNSSDVCERHQGRQRLLGCRERLQRRRRSPGENGERFEGYSGTWGELNPFDPVQNPKAHLLLERRSMSESPERRQNNLSSFRPSFRTEWLVALREELLVGTRVENAQLRRDFDKAISSAVTQLSNDYDVATTAIRAEYKEAAEAIRHDFIDCFVDGDISGMIEAAGKTKRLVDVDFCPVFEEMDKLKLHMNASESEVLEAIRTLRKDNNSLREETSRLVVDLTDSVSDDLLKIARLVENVGVGQSAQTDFSPVLEAIGKIDTRTDLSPVLSALEVISDMDVKLQDAQRGTLEKMSQMRQQSQDDAMVLLNAVGGTGLDIAGVLDDQLAYLKKVCGTSEASLQALSKIGAEIASSGQRVEESLKVAGGGMGKVDFSPVLAALAKLDMAPVVQKIDEKFTETCKHIHDAASPEKLQPVFEALQALDLSVDLSPILASSKKVLDALKHVESHQKQMKTTIDEIPKAVASCIPPVDLAPVLGAIGAVDVQPQVHINMQSVNDAISAATAECASAVGATTEKIVSESSAVARADAERLADKLAGALAAMDEVGERRSRAIVDDLAILSSALSSAVKEIKVSEEVVKREIEKTSRESVDNILKPTSAAFRKAEVALSVGLQQLSVSIDAIDIPEVDLNPVLDSISTIDFSEVTSRIDATHVATLATIQNEIANVAKTDVIAPVLQAMAKSDSALQAGFSALQSLEADSKALQKATLDVATRIDTKPPVDLGPVQDLLTVIDAKPPVDLQPVLDAVSAIDFNPVIKPDTRPVIDAMSAGLARIEVAWAQVDLREITDMLKKLDNRLLEAHVKIDAKDPNRSDNFIWSSAAAKWT